MSTEFPQNYHKDFPIVITRNSLVSSSLYRFRVSVRHLLPWPGPRLRQSPLAWPLQDRLVKELRMAKISTIEEANRYLREVYLPKINEKFAKAPARPQAAHVPLTTPTSLEDILC